MKLDKRSASFEIHWHHEDSLKALSESEGVNHRFNHASLTQYLENMGSDAIHVLAFWNQLQHQLLDARAQAEAVNWMELIEKVQVLEDLYWGLELTLAERHGREN